MSVTHKDCTLSPGSKISPYDDSRFVATVTVTKATPGLVVPETSVHMVSPRAFGTRGQAVAAARAALTYQEFLDKFVAAHEKSYQPA